MTVQILFFCLFCCSLFSDRVEIACNGICQPQDFAALLAERGKTESFTEFDFHKHPALCKEQNLLGKLRSYLPFSCDKEVRKIIFMNVPSKARKRFHLAKLPREKMVLFMWEPPLRFRKMYGKKTQDCFSRIYTWNDDLVDSKIYFKFYYPALRPMIEERPSFEEKQFCTMVIGNTSDKAKHSESLYPERKKAIQFFESVGEAGFAFYGRNWDPAQYKSYRGPIDDKIAVMKNYRFAICYENSKDLKGYITEKIFDCFCAGAIPIYWGASNVTEYIPKDCFIDRRDFQNLDQLYLFLKKMQKEEYESYIERIQHYLKSDKAQLFSVDHFAEIFWEALQED